MAGSINDIDAMILPLIIPIFGRPETGCGSRSNGYAALFLLLHPIHGRTAIMNLTHPVKTPRIIEDPLSGRGLTGINVSHNADVTNLIQCNLPCHIKCFILFIPVVASEAEMCKRFIRISHTMNLIALLHRSSLLSRSIHQLRSQLFSH